VEISHRHWAHRKPCDPPICRSPDADMIDEVQLQLDAPRTVRNNRARKIARVDVRRRMQEWFTHGVQARRYLPTSQV
jgi:hypothetical protein